MLNVTIVGWIEADDSDAIWGVGMVNLPPLDEEELLASALGPSSSIGQTVLLAKDHRPTTPSVTNEELGLT